jgi:hypothetical protein
VTGDGAARHHRRRRLAAITIGVVVAAGVGTGLAVPAGLFRSAGSAADSGTTNVATAVVTRRSLTEQTSVTAALGYAGSYPVTGRAAGTITWLPAVGQVIHQGQVLYRVDNGTPVLLLTGTVPDWRALSEGTRGADVSQLNHALVALGYANSAEIVALGWDHFSWQTRYALEKLQSAAGISDPSGSLPLGQVAFEPTELRVTSLSVQLGSPGQALVLTATSTTPVVSIALDPSMQSAVKTGDAVTITLPNGTTTPGAISSVGTVATSSSASGSSGSGPGSGNSGGSGGSSGSLTIPVQVTLPDPRAAAGLDQAQVSVTIRTGSVSDALVVPVTALVARDRGYAVEQVTPGGTSQLVAVVPGLFDDLDGLVQVTGPGLASGQRVVVPSE